MIHFLLMIIIQHIIISKCLKYKNIWQYLWYSLKMDVYINVMKKKENFAIIWLSVHNVTLKIIRRWWNYSSRFSGDAISSTC